MRRDVREARSAGDVPEQLAGVVKRTRFGATANEEPEPVDKAVRAFLADV